MKTAIYLAIAFALGALFVYGNGVIEAGDAKKSAQEPPVDTSKFQPAPPPGYVLDQPNPFDKFDCPTGYTYSDATKSCAIAPGYVVDTARFDAEQARNMQREQLDTLHAIQQGQEQLRIDTRRQADDARLDEQRAKWVNGG